MTITNKVHMVVGLNPSLIQDIFQITFQCAAVDKIKYVSEKEVCTYGAKFDTPAACPNLAHLENT